MKTHKIYLLLVFFLLISIAGPASSLTKDLLGVAPEDEKYFRPEIIKCKDGSRKFTKAQLNDDFCDCTDGTDEPGTSACPGGMFHCRNSGHVPLSLFSSRVNDGICDCCDGSDEYDGKVNCSNTCWEAGKAAREKLIKKIATYQDGVSIRKQEVEQAKHAIAKDEAELSKLKNEEKILKGLVQQLKEHKEQIEKVEEKERLEKEKEERRKKEAEEKADQEKNQSSETPTDDTTKVPEDPPVDQDLVDDKSESEVEVEVEIGDNAESEESHTNGVGQHATQEGKDESIAVSESGHDAGTEASPYDLVKEKKYGSGSTEGLSREELGRLVASRWTGENTEQQTKGIDSGKEEAQESEEMKPENVIDEEYDDSNSETEEENHKYDEHDIEDVNVDDVYGEDNEEYEEEDLENLGDTQRYESDNETDYSDITGIGSSSWLDKIRQTVRNILQAVKLFQTPVDISEAAHVRKEYDDSSAKLSKIQSRISKLTEKLKQDFGAQKEFYSFYNRCFENKQNKYVYKVCPFKQASQVEGHGSTQLGQWDKFEDSYKVMLFSNGANCWNGPDRSLKVKLRCGLKNELADVDEPSRCEYVAVLSTPALCLEEKLKELQQKLDLMNKEQPQDHDEL